MRVRKHSISSPSEHGDPATGSHIVRAVILAILVLTGMSLVSQTKVIKTASLLDQFSRSLYAGVGISTGADTYITNSHPAPDPGRYPPFSCSKLLNILKQNPSTQTTDPNRGLLHVRRTITEPPFYVSLHNQTFDGTRWG